METQTLGLVPLFNFGEINKEKRIYRCGQPQWGFQYAWLKNVLGIKTIINIRAEANVDIEHAPSFGIKVVTFAVKDHFAPTITQAKRFMQLIKESDAPIIIHCEHGHGRTSTFSVLAKMAMGQDVEIALRDEKKRFHYEFKHVVQEAFLRDKASKIKI